ncbi:MAG: TetR/AcrR family transcriptional regulator C-terminal domain-containing protein [Myxococcaceae bacterium]
MEEGKMPARRRLSRERVVAAALRIVDRDGLEGLTMRALGRELGVDPMAVYHWVPNKDELLGLIVEAVYAEIPLDPALLPEGDWRARFAYAAGVFRDTLERHPNALPVLATRPASSGSLTALRPSEFAMGLLRAAGFSAQDAMRAVTAMANLVIGFVLAEVGLPPGAEADVSAEQQSALLASMTPEEFPNILEALPGPDPRRPGAGLHPRGGGFGVGWDAQFAFGLNALIRGLEPLRALG